MASVSSTRSNDSYDAEWASVQDKHERALTKAKSEEEKALTEAKEDYQNRLKDLRNEATEQVRRVKDESYNAQGRLAGMERENIHDRERITSAYGAALDKEVSNRQNQDKAYELKIDSVRSDANQRTESQVSAQKSEFLKISDDQRQQTESEIKYIEAQLAQEKINHLKSSEQLVHQNQRSTEEALNKRTENYEGFIKENDKNTKQKLEEMKKEIAELKSTDDPDKVSLQVKNKIEGTYQKKFNDELNEEKRVDAVNTTALKDQNINYQQKVRDGYAEKYNDLSKSLHEHHKAEKQVLVRGYQDLEASSELTQKKLEDRHVDFTQRTYQKHAAELSLQEQRNQEQIKDQRATLMDERFKDKDELESKQRDAERNFNYKLTDTRREYEKKILDQKDLHDKETEQTKFEFDKKLQEQQRVSKRTLDDRVRAYEAQLKTQDSMFKEHDRLLTEHYEEELDKLKRTNARITQAKS